MVGISFNEGMEGYRKAWSTAFSVTLELLERDDDEVDAAGAGAGLLVLLARFVVIEVSLFFTNDTGVVGCTD